MTSSGNGCTPPPGAPQVPFRWANAVWMLGALALTVLGTRPVAAATKVTATAELRDAAGTFLGTASLWQAAEGVRVDATLHDLSPGSHAAHIHELGRCDPPAFASAGQRSGPLMGQRGMDPTDPHYVGDLLNVDDAELGSNFRSVGGVLTLHGLARGASLGPGPTALIGPNGAALVVHAQRDDDVHDQMREAGGRVACGVVIPVRAPAGPPAAVPVAAPVAQDGSTLLGQAPDVQASFRAAWGDRAAEQWVRQHDNAHVAPVTPSPTAEIITPSPTPETSSTCPQPTSDPDTACLLADRSAVSGSITNAGGMHVYRFVVSSPHAIGRARLINLAADYDLYLVDDTGVVLGQSVQEGTAPETVEMDLASGTYFLYVYADVGRPVPSKAPYELLLEIDPPPEAQP
jgi:superoxide dismutase, Cu-Zn family